MGLIPLLSKISENNDFKRAKAVEIYRGRAALKNEVYGPKVPLTLSLSKGARNVVASAGATEGQLL